MVRREQNVSELRSEQEVVSLSAVSQSPDSVKITDKDSYSQASDTTSCEHTVCDL